MKNIPLGLCASVVAVLVWLGIFGTLAVVSLNQLFFFKHPIGVKILGLIVYVGTPTILGLALLGVGLAIGGLRQADRRKTPAVLGLVLNGLFLLGALVLGVAYVRAEKWGKKRDGKAPAWEAPSLATAHRSYGQEQTPGPSDGEDWTVPGIGMEFVWIEALKYWVGKYEVTNSECRGFKPDHGSVPSYKGHSLAADRQPVVYVSYDDAVVYAEWLTERERQAGRLDGMRYRLPDGNQWTVFAQCGDGRQYPWGNEWPPRYGNYCDQSSASPFGKADDGYDDGFPVTCPVEKSGKNDWGLYGVGGNVWEWTSELHPKLKSRALRGASWRFYGKNVTRCKHRYFLSPSSGMKETGFRLLLSR